MLLIGPEFLGSIILVEAPVKSNFTKVMIMN